MQKSPDTCLSILKNLAGFILFELKSAAGRLFSSRLSVDPSRENYINLGCGDTLPKGFINLDFFFTKGIDFAADLRFPLKIPDQCIDGIISEHTFEHLPYKTSRLMFSECHRILKPGGILRVIVPDLSIFIRNYAENKGEWFANWERLMFTDSGCPEREARKLLTPLEAISFVTQEYGHRSCWDFETLKAHMDQCGFTNITKTDFRKGKNSKLLIDQDHPARKFVSVYVEAEK